MTTTVYYVHDPMCSWCWGFSPALGELLAGLPAGVEVRRLLGGLAADSELPMGSAMRERLQDTWRNIQRRVPGTRFNFDFWTSCSPRRSTWPACRAVIAARRQDPVLDQAMTRAIQHAYYLEARNPSDRDTLTALAAKIGADPAAFAQALDAPATQAELEAEIDLSRGLGADGFPSIILDRDGSRWRVPVDYGGAGSMLKTIELVSIEWD